MTTLLLAACGHDGRHPLLFHHPEAARWIIGLSAAGVLLLTGAHLIVWIWRS